MKVKLKNKQKLNSSCKHNTATTGNFAGKIRCLNFEYSLQQTALQQSKTQRARRWYFLPSAGCAADLEATIPELLAWTPHKTAQHALQNPHR
jgi:hypothetical protein